MAPAWRCAGAAALALLLAVLLWRRRSDERLVWGAHEHEEARHGEDFAWRDCTGRAPSGAALKRAYRRLARQSHPDKMEGSNDRFRALSEAEQQLQSPLQYNLRAALARNSSPSGHGIRDARLKLAHSEGGARIHLEVDFTSPAPRGFWKFGLLAKGISSIEYSGDGRGYDVCCQFLKDSRCKHKPYAELVSQHAAHTDLSWDAAYVVHDCPLLPDKVYTGVVDKPLHVSADGLWVAVVEIVDDHGMELACAAASFNLSGEELRPLAGTKVQL